MRGFRFAVVASVVAWILILGVAALLMGCAVSVKMEASRETPEKIKSCSDRDRASQ